MRDCLASKKLYPLVTTTCAPTQIEGGSTGANVMPQDMWANINFRMLEGTSVADVVARCREAVAGADLAGRVEVELGPGSSEPSPSPRIGVPASRRFAPSPPAISAIQRGRRKTDHSNQWQLCPRP